MSCYNVYKIHELVHCVENDESERKCCNNQRNARRFRVWMLFYTLAQ